MGSKLHKVKAARQRGRLHDTMKACCNRLNSPREGDSSSGLSEAIESRAANIVLKRASASILVVLPDNSRHAATVIARDRHRDLVLLKIKTDKTLTAVDLPDEIDVPIGSTVVATGRYGIEQSPLVSSGILSATERLDGIALQTDARVSPSFYGGLLVDLYGNPIGVLIPAVAEGGAPDDTSWYDSGIAFAIPTDVLKKKLSRLIDGDDVKKGTD